MGFIADNGIPVAEVFLTTYSEYRPSFARELLKRQGNTEVLAVHALNTQFEGQLFSGYERQRQDATELITQIWQIANTLKAKYYVLHGPHLYKFMQYTTNYLYFAGIYRQLCERAADFGLKIAWENVHWAHFNHPEFPIQLKKHLDIPFHCVLDVKQAMQSGYGAGDYMRKMGESLCHVHLCDYDAEKSLSLPGRGIFNFSEFFAQLEQNGFTGACMVEAYSRCYQNTGELMEAYRYLCGF